MPVHPEGPRFKGITLPPSGLTLATLLALYIFSGLIGHDPWKNDDAVTIGIVDQMLSTGNWLTPGLAGRPYPDAPLYYWLAAAGSLVSSWLLPVHDGVRLASGVCTLLALAFILLAARELHGREQAPAAPLLLAGSIGFLFHAHEAQPMLAALTAHTAAYWGLLLIGRQPLFGASVFGLALGAGFLANGLPPMLPLLPLAAFAACRSDHKAQAASMVLGALFLAALISGAWLLALLAVSPDYLAAFWQADWTQLRGNAQPFGNLWGFLKMLPWYAWPALPLAGWTLWARRRQLLERPVAMPLSAFLIVLIGISLSYGARSAPALLLLPPLVLLAVPGIASLRRGAANAFDWFGMITFSLFSVLVWIAWCALIFGWPERLAHKASRLEPGFVAQFSLPAVSLALIAMSVWCWLIVTSPRSPMRGIMHWMSGLTLLWLLTATLLMPWIDYGKTYRPVSAALARALPAEYNCVASLNVADSVLASVDYFDRLRTLPTRKTTGIDCDWLLVHGVAIERSEGSGGEWRKVWEGGRPGDRRSTEKLRLYQRVPRSAKE